MADRLSRSAPYQITDINIHSINDVFRQIQAAVDETKGLLGSITLYSAVTFNSSQFGSATDLKDVAATEDLGTSEKLVRADHRHAHGSGYLPDAHHDKSHQALHNTGGVDALKLDDLASPDDNTDLNSTASAHGLLRKLSGTATEYLDGSGAFSTPSGSAEQKTPAFVDGVETQSDWEIVLHGLQEFLYSFKDSVIHLLGENRFRYLNVVCRASKVTTDQTLTTDTVTAISLNTESFDTDTIHDNVTDNSRLTIRLAGKYLIIGGAGWEAEATSTQRLTGIRFNGATITAQQRAPSAVGANPFQIVGDIQSLAVGDYVELVCLHSHGLDTDVLADNGTFLALVYIGE